MSKFKLRKRIVIEAWRNGLPKSDHPDWLISAMNDGSVWFSGGERPYFTIKTIEGEMRADYGDWIVKGAVNELYPCKPDIFAAIYEAVE